MGSWAVNGAKLGPRLLLLLCLFAPGYIIVRCQPSHRPPFIAYHAKPTLFPPGAACVPSSSFADPRSITSPLPPSRRGRRLPDGRGGLFHHGLGLRAKVTRPKRVRPRMMASPSGPWGRQRRNLPGHPAGRSCGSTTGRSAIITSASWKIHAPQPFSVRSPAFPSLGL